MALISFAVTAKLICVFDFAYAKCWFSHDAAHINDDPVLTLTYFKAKSTLVKFALCAYTKSFWQVSVYMTIGPLVIISDIRAILLSTMQIHLTVFLLFYDIFLLCYCLYD